MSELTNIVAIYGAIDRKVAEDADRRRAVARLLGVYRDPRVRWFDDFEAWTMEQTEGRADPFPSLLEALENLGGFVPRGRMRARRLFAIALAIQAFPELRDPGSAAAAMARSALRPRGGRAETEEGAQRLLDLLGEDELLPTEDGAPGSADAWWDEVIKTASAEGLVVELRIIGPRPCTGRVVPGPSGLEAHLSTSFETDLLSFNQAIGFLDPSTWEKCGDFFWCEMDRVRIRPPGVHEYYEIVSLDCARRPHTWTIEAWLDFTFWRSGQQVAVANYTLSQNRYQPDVLVDNGTLMVQQIPNSSRLKIQTTKAIRFNRPFSGAALALIMCALGYASVVEDFVFTCAVEGVEGTAFPGESEEDSPALPPRRFPTMTGAPDHAHTAERSPAAEDSPSRPRTGRRDFGPVFSDIADDVATTLKGCIEDCTVAAKESYEKMDSGDYRADDLVRDMSRMWVRMLREGASLADLGVRSAQRAARPRARPPSRP